MHVTQVLNNQLLPGCQGVHKKRWTGLMVAVNALLSGKKLSVTGLGRAISSSAYEKHKIKQADRLIGNPALNQERIEIYRALTRMMTGRHHHPVILVDWSDLTADRKFHLLRASVAVGGRALTIYEECHTQSRAATPRVHKRFLDNLQSVLPGACRPILITDAGFRNPWFKAVQAMGWDYVGRVGGHTMISPQGRNDWIRVEQVFNEATEQPRYLGHVDLAKNNPLACHAYLVKKKKKGRIKKTKFGQRCAMKHSEKNAHRERTPWLIVTSIHNGEAVIKEIMHLYATRMQIEESFRDVKNSRWGFSLDEARCTTTYRYENLLLIGSLATLAVWLIGKIAELKQWHRRYQANTVRTRNVLSVFYLGCQVLRSRTHVFRHPDYIEAIRALRQQVKEQNYAWL